MDEHSFPGKASVEFHGDKIRKRNTAEQASSSGRLGSQDGSTTTNRHRPSGSDTMSRLQEISGLDPGRDDFRDIDLDDLGPQQTRRSEIIHRPPPSPSGRTIGEVMFPFATPYDSDPTPRIPDPELGSTPTFQPNQLQRAPSGTWPWIKEKLRPKPAPMPTAELLREMQNHFPFRANLPVFVFDFYATEAKRSIVPLGKIESVMFSKPPEVEVRWIHAPLGLGLFHSSVEDIFLRGEPQIGARNLRRPSALPRGKIFDKAGRAGWPYLETECLNVRSKTQMKKSRDIALAFIQDSEAQKELDRKVFDNDGNVYLRDDVHDRANHLGRRISYWDTVKSDLPLLLSDGALNMKSPAASKQQPNLTLKTQTLQEDPSYKYAYLARDACRCFHRGDGFLLSLSPSTGLDYLNSDLLTITRDSCSRLSHWRSSDGQQEESEFPNKNLSVIGHVFDAFERSGTQGWHHKTAEWLMVYLMTEIACAPDSRRSGYSVATILDAYDTQVSKLIEQKFAPWAREETAQLFQSYLRTIDELKTLGQIYKKKLSFLKHLHEDCKTIERELEKSKETVSTSEAMTMVGRVNFAKSAVADSVEQCDQLTTELTASLNLMFQLRTIEQHDRAISVDSQSRAVLLLSGVTIIFLPLSFVASFFGMNVEGIAGTPLSHFWKICGYSTVTIVLLVSLFIWRVRSGNHLKTLMTVFGTKKLSYSLSQAIHSG